MILIDLDDVVGIDDTPLVVLHKTGVFYTGQCGGIGCSHPKAEGFVLNIGDFAQDFDDCSYGCSYLDLPNMRKNREALAKDFDIYCIAKTKGWTYKINFDFKRIDEVQEGWLPVILNGEKEGIHFRNQKAIIHNGNCD